MTREHSASGETLPLSPIQHGMLYHHLTDRQSDVDLVQVMGELREPLDADRFLAIFERIAARHEAFRTRFHWTGGATPVQEIVPEVQLPSRVLDWRDRAP